MNCVTCEILRARLKVHLGLYVGMSLKQIAEGLSEDYGEHYYVGYGDMQEPIAIFRANKLPPHEPYVIYET